uniref:Sine oculis-binding protein n=1 Tax=Anopheles farauti TaxID=69004 RepID=A0A182QMJ5_9DIPT
MICVSFSPQELAETAMNDILGWYGYDSVDRLELAANNLASASASNTIDEDGAEVRLKADSDHVVTRAGSTTNHHLLLKAKSIAAASSQPHPPSQQTCIAGGHFFPRQQDDPSASSSGERRGLEAPSTTNPISNRPGLSGSPPAATVPTTRNGIGLHHQSHQPHHHASVPAGGGESSTSEKDSSRESSKSPMLMKMLDKQEQTCQWCRKVIPSHQPGILGTTEGMIFCTEACFSQSRRASFKRAKTCDWCRHVRHAVSYVDFQDGASQLQFCSDKCLNQYKMQIFCNETQAHLELNPHLKEKSSSAGSLITPELWMKNCKSCSMSPVSDRSESVSPVPSLPDLRILQKKHNAIVNLASNAGPAPMAGFDHGRVDGSGPGTLGPPPPPPPPQPPLNIPPQFLPPPLNLLRPPFFPLNPVAQLRFGNGMSNVPSTAPSMGPPPSPLPSGPLGPGSRPPVPNLFGFGAATPPVTILVPYPIIVPLPLPIPVPIPVIDFLKAALPKDSREKHAERVLDPDPPEDKMDAEASVMTVDSDELVAGETVDTSLAEEDMDVPLDFTVGGCGKQSERNAPGSTVEVLGESEQCSDCAPAYTLSTIASNEPESMSPIDDVKSGDPRRVGSANLVLPRFKLTRLESADTLDPGERLDEERRPPPPPDEEDIERERKEMVERSRPLRKRKRLVVPQQQQLQSSGPDQNDLYNPPREGNAEPQEFSCGIGLRSGSKTK